MKSRFTLNEPGTFEKIKIEEIKKAPKVGLTCNYTFMINSPGIHWGDLRYCLHCVSPILF
jgi:hypothetical protein